MVIALVLAGTIGAGFAAYQQGGSTGTIIGFALGGAVAGYLLSRLRHWKD